MAIEVLDPGSYRRERWKNGQGWTHEIARGVFDRGGITAQTLRDAGASGSSTSASADWDWRLSIATIESDGPFSAFPGVERTLVLLDGNGMSLRFDDGADIRLVVPGDRVDFAGERALHSELRSGPTRDFNAMWLRERVDGGVDVRDIAGAVWRTGTEGGVLAVHVIGGRLSVRADGACSPVDGSAAFDVHGATDAGVEHGVAGRTVDANARHRDELAVVGATGTRTDRVPMADNTAKPSRTHGRSATASATTTAEALRIPPSHVDVERPTPARTYDVPAGHTLIARDEADRALELTGPATVIIARFVARPRD